MAGIFQSIIKLICQAYLKDVILFSIKRTKHTADCHAHVDQIRAANL